MKLKEKYIHFEDLHDLYSPSQIAPVVFSLFKPQSVIDVGCGLGTFLHEFKKSGSQVTIGIDGEWCNKKLLYKNITEEEFIECDLEKQIKLDQHFDLVICLEVAEHLSSARAESFISDLVSLGDVVLFSAAIPGTGGINHINEQWPEYWEKFFNAHGYVKQDILKPFFWNNSKIWRWYKQNMLIYTKENFIFKTEQSIVHNPLNNVIHPELYNSKVQKLSALSKGQYSLFYYIKLLGKSILFKLKLYK